MTDENPVAAVAIPARCSYEAERLARRVSMRERAIDRRSRDDSSSDGEPSAVCNTCCRRLVWWRGGQCGHAIFLDTPGPKLILTAFYNLSQDTENPPAVVWLAELPVQHLDRAVSWCRHFYWYQELAPTLTAQTTRLDQLQSFLSRVCSAQGHFRLGRQPLGGASTQPSALSDGCFRGSKSVASRRGSPCSPFPCHK